MAEDLVDSVGDAAESDERGSWLRSPAAAAWWEWIFCLGFAAAGAMGAAEYPNRRQLHSLGRALPWVAIPMVFVWSEIYQLPFWGMLLMLELQGLIVGAAVVAFAPRRSARLFREAAVNAFVAMALTFLALVLVSFLFGLILLILSEGD